MPDPGQRRRRGLVAREEHRHHLVADLPRVDADAIFPLRRKQHAEQVVAPLIGAKPLGHDTVNGVIEHRPGTPEPPVGGRGQAFRPVREP